MECLDKEEDQLENGHQLDRQGKSPSGTSLVKATEEIQYTCHTQKHIGKLDRDISAEHGNGIIGDAMIRHVWEMRIDLNLRSRARKPPYGGDQLDFPTQRPDSHSAD